MADLNTDDQAMRRVLQDARVIAVVGHSDKSQRTSYRIAQYLRGAGYTVYPVNPTVRTIDGRPSYPTLADVPAPIDIVNIFRQPVFLPAIIDEAIAVGAKAVWAQLGVYDADAQQRALTAGLDVAMNACIKVEHLRLFNL